MGNLFFIKLDWLMFSGQSSIMVDFSTYGNYSENCMVIL